MKDARHEIIEIFDGLNPENQKKVLLFITFMTHCPGFVADLKAVTPKGENIPQLEVIEALMNKWKGKAIV